MERSSQHRRSRLPVSELDRVILDEPKTRLGLSGTGWLGLALFVILLTVFLLLIIDGRSVVHARERGRPWSTAMAAGDWPTVLTLAKAESDKNPRDPEAKNAYGLALMETGKLTDAEAPLIAAESLAPEVTDYKVDLGDLYSRRGVSELAATKYREAVDLDPSLVDVRWKLARSLYATREFDQTLDELTEITRLEPDNWDAYRLTADVAIGRKKYDEAIDNLKLYTSVVPDARAWSKLAFAYMSLSPPDTAAARRAAERSLQINPDDSQAHIALARVSLLQKQGDAALAHYADASKFFVPHRDSYLEGRIHEQKREAEAAEKSYRIAASIDSTNKDYLSQLGSNLILQQKYADAIPVYTRLLTVDPGNMSALSNKAQALIQTGKAEEAEALLTEAIKTNEANPGLQSALGDLYLKKGDRANARASYQRALELNPENKVGSRVAEQLGYMIWEDGDFAGAVPVLRKAMGYDQCNTRAALTLANCQMKLNQTADAISLLRQVDTNCPGDPQVRQMLKAIGG